MIVIWQIVKLGLSQMLGFIQAYWRIILPILVLGYCYYEYNVQVVRAVNAERNLAVEVAASKAFKENIVQLTSKRTSENQMKLSIASKALKDSELENKALYKKYNLDRARESTELRAYYENRIDSTKSNFIERMRLEADRISSGLPEVAGDPGRLTEGERECNAAYSTLEHACQITTVDFNRCRGWADIACDQVGCE